MLAAAGCVVAVLDILAWSNALPLIPAHPPKANPHKARRAQAAFWNENFTMHLR
jgi:hypothetical protein